MHCFLPNILQGTLFSPRNQPWKVILLLPSALHMEEETRFKEAEELPQNHPAIIFQRKKKIFKGKSLKGICLKPKSNSGVYLPLSPFAPKSSKIIITLLVMVSNWYRAFSESLIMPSGSFLEDDASQHSKKIFHGISLPKE